MVDREKRETIKKIGVGGLLLGGVSGAGYGTFRTVSDILEEQERKDNIIDTRKEIQQVEEKYAGKDWSLSAIDPAGITVSFDRTGTTEDGVAAYTASTIAPIADSDIAVCPHAASPKDAHALARKLERDAVHLFDGLYDKTARLTPPYRDAEEERIVEYRVGFEDASGVAVADIEGGEAYRIAQEADWFDPDIQTDRDNFLDVYYRAFDARCHSDG